MKNRLNRPRYTRRSSTLLAVYFFVSLIIPNIVLLYTEPYSIWSAEASLLMPLGFYMIWSVALRRSGVMIWLAFPFIFICAFQIVLLYLFGNSIIAADMLTNVLTTNPGEAGELLGNIYPSIIIVCAMYVPLLWFASREIGHRRYLSHTTRKNLALLGVTLMAIGGLILAPAYRVSEDKRVLKTDIFPLNVFYNASVTASELRKMYHYEHTSRNFRYDARRTADAPGREIYILVIGEASRAQNWQLYGYERETNPRLSRMGDIVVFRNLITQSNTTHKSVPLILSSVRTDEHEELYRRRGLPALFNEAGFRTWFLSNQAPQGAMIDKLARDADSVVYLRNPRHDMQLLDTIRRIVADDRTNDLLLILHTYGSHFSYHQRYPRQYAYFKPDNNVAIAAANHIMIRNAYDNSIRYTDDFLASMIEFLRNEGSPSALLYCSDHGEDLLDDERGRFLHASPTTTFYQLWAASLAWFSPAYCSAFPEQVEAARANADAPATTRALFQTMAGMASIEGRHVDPSASLVNPAYDRTAPRRYLNDHNLAVPFTRTGMSKEDIENFRRNGIVF